MSDYYLVDDLWVQILLSLPMKSLVSSSCVCKSWNTIITSSDFIHDHLNRSRVSTHTTRQILVRYNVCDPDLKEVYSLRIDNASLDLYKNLDFPFRTFYKDNYFRILGSCNGLICLADDLMNATDRYILWNPSIAKSVTLPLPRFTSEHYEDAIGFGFDSRTNDYKVVRLALFDDDEEEDWSHRVELFKLSTGLWETISISIKPVYWVEYNCGHVFLNGAVQWLASHVDIPQIILSFDMSEELFHNIMLPVCLSNKSANAHITVCGECLSFSCSSSFGAIQIWVMKEYGVVDSWNKFYLLDLPGVRIPVRIKTNCEMLLEMLNDGHLLSYDVKSQRTNYLGTCGSDKQSLSRFRPSFYVGTYEESLVLLGHGNGSRKDTDVRCKQ